MCDVSGLILFIMFENLMKRKNLEFNEKNAFFVAEHLKLNNEKINELKKLANELGKTLPFPAIEILQKMIDWSKKMSFEELKVKIPEYFILKASGQVL